MQDYKHDKETIVSVASEKFTFRKPEIKLNQRTFKHLMFFCPFYFKFMRAGLYTRVSTSGQNTKRQIEELEVLCSQNEWKVVKSVSETISGAEPYRTRKGFQELLNKAKERELDIIVVHEISRLGRNTVDVLKCIQEINSIGSSVHIMNIGITVKPDRADPSANLIVAVLASLATHERELMQKRIISGIKSSNKKSGRAKGVNYSLEDYEKKYPIVIRLLKDGYKLKEVSDLTKVSYRTVQRIKKIMQFNS